MVHCWGTDYDDAMLLEDQFVRSMIWTLTSGNFTLGQGRWTDSTRVAVRGRELVSECSWIEPVTATPVTLSPSGTVVHASLYIDGAGNPTGSVPVTVNG
jgi:hypothetical protein